MHPMHAPASAPSHLVGQQEGEAVTEGRLSAAARWRPIGVHHPPVGVALCGARRAAGLPRVAHQAAGQAQVAGPPGRRLVALVCAGRGE